MKTFFTLIMLLTSFYSLSQENYIIEINGEKTEVALDKEYTVKVNGEKTKIKITQKNILTYDDSFFSFEHHNTNSISKVKLDEGIEQIMIVKADGKGFIIQKYESIDPSMIKEFMLSEVTKESISYGYELKREDYERTLVSGEKIEVLKAVLTYKDETNIYEVCSYAKKDEGIMVVTMNVTEGFIKGNEIIDLMWKSLSIK